jgi:hypothetical protein
MGKRVRRSIEEPLRGDALSYAERWFGEDRGLITCWELGRKTSVTKPEPALQARKGQLPQLGWKGGIPVERPKYSWRWGSLTYLAEWQGLRGDDLDIDLLVEREVTCSRTGIRVIFTGDRAKLGVAEQADQLV